MLSISSKNSAQQPKTRLVLVDDNLGGCLKSRKYFMTTFSKNNKDVFVAGMPSTV
jgi:hypothetical protein